MSSEDEKLQYLEKVPEIAGKAIEKVKSSESFGSLCSLYETQKDRSFLKPTIEAMESGVVRVVAPVVAKTPELLKVADKRVAEAKQLYDSRAPAQVKSLVAMLLPHLSAVVDDPAAAYAEAIRVAVDYREKLIAAVTEALNNAPDQANVAVGKVRDAVTALSSTTVESGADAYAKLVESLAKSWAAFKEAFPEMAENFDKLAADFLDAVAKVQKMTESPRYAAFHARAAEFISAAKKQSTVASVLAYPAVQTAVGKVEPYVSPVLERLAPVAVA